MNTDMKKQTAVEWLGLNLNSLFLDISPELWLEVELIFQQAKAMEKEQIVDAFDNGAEEWTPIEYSDGQDYYNETYNL